jgi:hypothetical protein
VAEDRVRVEIGFDGGQVAVVNVASADADRLEQALAEASDSALALEVEEGRYTVSLKRVVYLKRFRREARVGFGA